MNCGNVKTEHAKNVFLQMFGFLRNYIKHVTLQSYAVFV